jgi:hypothetical protein
LDYFNDVLNAWPDSLHKIPVQAGEKNAMLNASNTLTTMAKEATAMQNNLMYPPFFGSNGWVISGN